MIPNLLYSCFRFYCTLGADFTVFSDSGYNIDIADLLIRWRQAGHTSGNSADTTTGTADDTSGNAPDPVFLQIQKYISPAHHDNVLALIEELELEVVGVGRMTVPPDDSRKYRKK